MSELDPALHSALLDEEQPEANDGSCTYAGATYGEGSRVCQGGQMMECRNGAWFPTGESC